MDYMNSEDWAQFVLKYEDAAAWLRARQLRNELRFLRHAATNNWQRARLAELEALDTNVNLELRT